MSLSLNSSRQPADILILVRSSFPRSFSPCCAAANCNCKTQQVHLVHVQLSQAELGRSPPGVKRRPVSAWSGGVYFSSTFSTSIIQSQSGIKPHPRRHRGGCVVSETMVPSRTSAESRARARGARARTKLFRRDGGSSDCDSCRYTTVARLLAERSCVFFLMPMVGWFGFLRDKPTTTVACDFQSPCVCCPGANGLSSLGVAALAGLSYWRWRPGESRQRFRVWSTVRTAVRVFSF